MSYPSLGAPTRLAVLTLLGLSTAMGCSGEDAGETPDELCEEALSPDGKVRCRDTEMVATARAYLLPSGSLRVELEGSPASKPAFYVELSLNAQAQADAPKTWNIGSETQDVSARFYDLKGIDEPLRESEPYNLFTLQRGVLTISTYEAGSRIEGVIRNAEFKDTVGLRGIARIPTMRFEITCIGAPAEDDADCAQACGVCQATDRCGNEVLVTLSRACP